MARRDLGPARLRLVNAVEQSLRPGDAPLIVACSGGADSLALAAAAVVVARRHALPLAAAVVDHGLQADSASIARRAATQLAAIGVGDVRVLTASVVETRDGPEAAARAARYAVLSAEAADTCATVLLGHTLDDQAETVLLGLARGSGVRSLAGMAARTGHFVRPLLGVPRTVTEAACVEVGLIPWSDPQNFDPRYARTRVRHRVLPLLEAELGPGIAVALARTAELARDDSDLLDRLAADAEPGVLADDGPDCAALADLPPALRRRVLLRWLQACGARDLAHAHVVAVEALAVRWHGQGPIDVPGLSVVRRAGRLVATGASGGTLGGQIHSPPWTTHRSRGS